jgi:hypothetical protein
MPLGTSFLTLRADNPNDLDYEIQITIDRFIPWIPLYLAGSAK